jgi:hypothetical protein
MASRKSWMNTAELLKSDGLRKLFPRLVFEDDKTQVLGRVGQGVSVADKMEPDTGAPRTPVDAPAAAPKPAPPPHVAKWTPMPRRSEVAHDEPSLASRVRPDLGSPDERHQSFLNAYHDKNAVNKTLRQHNKGSLNVVFHGNLESGHQYIAKPHEGIGHRDLDQLDPHTLASLRAEAPDFGRRHDAKYELMSAMGAHHMVVPGVTTNMHGRHQFKGPDPDDDDDYRKRLTMAAHHANGLAHVQEFVPGAVNVNHATPEQLDTVDHEHRLHGIVSHLLFGAQDGHGGNVMIHPAGHPVLIDHDLTLGTPQAALTKEKYGKDAFMSVFSPGGPLDYQAKLPKDSSGQVIPVGTNFPPRMRETLERAAEGYFADLDLSPADHAELQKNARQLLSYGLEGTLERKHDMGAELNARLAQKQALNAQVDAVQAAPVPAPAKKPRGRKRR